VEDPHIKLDQFLKWSGAVDSGGQAKILIQEEKVLVNGQIEVRRGRKLRAGDKVQLEEKSWTVDLENRPEAQ